MRRAGSFQGIAKPLRRVQKKHPLGEQKTRKPIPHPLHQQIKRSDDLRPREQRNSAAIEVQPDPANQAKQRLAPQGRKRLTTTETQTPIRGRNSEGNSGECRWGERAKHRPSGHAERLSPSCAVRIGRSVITPHTKRKRSLHPVQRPFEYELEATPGFEPGVKALQASALPLGHVAD